MKKDQLKRIILSILIPCLNSAHYISACLDSVVSQTLTDLEIIIIDAGSTDGTIDIINRFAESDPRIRVLHSPVKSYGAQMNQGLAAAKGQYVGIVESDDFVDTDMFERLYSAAVKAEKEKGIRPDIVKESFCQFGNIGKREITCTYDAPYFPDGVIDLSSCPDFRLKDPMHFWSAIYWRDFLLEKNIRFNETPGASYQDTGFTLLANMLAETAVHLPDAGYHYRIDNGSSSVKDRKKIFFVREEIHYALQILSKTRDFSAEERLSIVEFALSAYRWNLDRLDEDGAIEFAAGIQADLADLSGELSAYAADTLHLLTDEDALKAEKQRQQERRTFLQTFVPYLLSGDSFILVSAGQRFQKLSQLEEILGLHFIEAVCDNSAGKQGQNICGHIVMSVEEAVAKFGDKTFLIANALHADELKDQLRGLGLSAEQIIDMRYVPTFQECFDFS